MVLNNEIQESGWSDTTSDDWFFFEDVKKAVEDLRKKLPDHVTEINEIFGSMDKGYDEINEV